MTLLIAPGDTRSIGPSDLVATADCGGLVWVAAWRATDVLRSAWLDGTTWNEIGQGRWGSVSLGCSALALRNDGGGAVSAELAYTVARR